MKWLLLWPFAGFAFWALYQARFFPGYPGATTKWLLVSLLAGPLSWVLMLMEM